MKNFLTPPPDFKLYEDKSVYISTFLGGPLAAGYWAAENFKYLGQGGKVQKTWIIAIIATVVIFGGAFLIPGIEKVPGYIIPLFYTGIAHYLVKRFQGNAIKTHIEKGGQIYSIWRAILIGIIGLTITLTIVLVIILLTHLHFYPNKTSANK